VTASVCLLSLAYAAQNENLDGAREAMGRGVRFMQRGNYAQAAKALEKAVEFAPTNMEAKLYLGICYMAQFHPGAPDPANLDFAHKAETQFQAILQVEPEDEQALQYMGNVAFQRAMGLTDPLEKRQQLERAKGWYEELEKDVPRNKEAPFTLAMIDWQQAHEYWLNARARAGMNPNTPGPVKDPAALAEMSARCGPIWDHAIHELKHVLDIDPDSDRAMMYLGIILRERADVAASDADYKRQIAEADDWSRKAGEIQARKAQSPPERQ